MKRQKLKTPDTVDQLASKLKAVLQKSPQNIFVGGNLQIHLTSSWQKWSSSTIIPYFDEFALETTIFDGDNNISLSVAIHRNWERRPSLFLAIANH